MTKTAIRPFRPSDLIRELTDDLTDEGYIVALHALLAYVSAVQHGPDSRCSCASGGESALRILGLELADATKGRVTYTHILQIKEHATSIRRAIGQPTLNRNTSRKAAA